MLQRHLKLYAILIVFTFVKYTFTRTGVLPLTLKPVKEKAPDGVPNESAKLHFFHTYDLFRDIKLAIMLERNGSDDENHDTPSQKSTHKPLVFMKKSVILHSYK